MRLCQTTGPSDGFCSMTWELKGKHSISIAHVLKFLPILITVDASHWMTHIVLDHIHAHVKVLSA
jgi:hypothetical protein